MTNITNLAAQPADKPFTATSHANIVRRVSNGLYYLHAKVAGKLVRASLETTDLKQAVILRDARLTLERQKTEASVADDGKLTLSKVVALYRASLAERATLGEHQKKNGLRPKSVEFYEGCLAKILTLAKPEFLSRKIAKFDTAELQALLKPVQLKFSATLYNGCAIVLRDIFEIAVQKKALLLNPAKGLDHETPAKKELTLPTREQWQELVTSIRSNKLNRRAAHSADIVEFLTYTGARITEAGHLRKEDVLTDRGLIRFRAGTTKNGEEKLVPIIPECQPIIDRWLANPNTKTDLLPIKNARKAIANACVRVGIAHLSPHDFRHLFTTTAIEQGKNPKLVAAWLGHKDAGQLALNTYGHVREDFSRAEAQTLKFGSGNLPEVKGKLTIGGVALTQEQVQALVAQALEINSRKAA